MELVKTLFHPCGGMNMCIRFRGAEKIVQSGAEKITKQIGEYDIKIKAANACFKEQAAKKPRTKEIEATMKGLVIERNRLMQERNNLANSQYELDNIDGTTTSLELQIDVQKAMVQKSQRAAAILKQNGGVEGILESRSKLSITLEDAKEASTALGSSLTTSPSSKLGIPSEFQEENNIDLDAELALLDDQEDQIEDFYHFPRVPSSFEPPGVYASPTKAASSIPFIRDETRVKIPS